MEVSASRIFGDYLVLSFNDTKTSIIVGNDLIFNQVCAIIQRNRGELRKPLTNATTLQRDLGIDGVDAEEVMTEYFSTFNVEGSQFNFDDYFGGEGFNPYLTLMYFLGKLKSKEISVGHLVECAHKGQWVLPEGP